GQGRALGFAAHRSFLSYMATVVAVEVDKQGQVRIPRVDLAVDAGRVIHPERVQAQFEGAAVFATSIYIDKEKSKLSDAFIDKMLDSPDIKYTMVPLNTLPKSIVVQYARYFGYLEVGVFTNSFGLYEVC
ncbi:MAG TPA: molybdopterin cofactor-binding domain-containing protein, partial [Candidatus Tectomicrobia bacterium]